MRMSKRDELLLRWEEYRDKLDEIKKSAPEERQVCVLEERIKAIYSVEDDEFQISFCDDKGNVIDSIYLTADGAKRLYHFLGGLYGE
jgi:hypothetical protein